MRKLYIFPLVLLFGILAACSGGESENKSDSANSSQLVGSGDQALIKSGERHWLDQCDTCHGAEGSSAGPAAPPISLGKYSSFDELVNDIYDTMPVFVPVNQSESRRACDMDCARATAEFIIAGYPSDAPVELSRCTSSVENHANSPVRLLTSKQYLALLESTFKEIDFQFNESSLRSAFVDEKVGGFLNNSGVVISENNFDKLFALAQQVGAQVAKELKSMLECQIVDENCADGFLQNYGKQLTRNNLPAELHNNLIALFNKSGGEQGMSDMVAALMISPRVLYQYQTTVEQRSVLKSNEIADRLSFFLWNRPADAELLELAAQGGLDSVSAITAQAEKMIADDRFKQSLAEFFKGWMHFKEDLQVNKNEAMGVDFPISGEEALEELLRFAGDLTRSGGTYSDLLLSTKAFVTDKTAAIYGVANSDLNASVETFWGGSQVNLDASQRAGLLTRLAFLASNGGEMFVKGEKVQRTSPTARGEFVRQYLLCQEPPKAPNVPFPEIPQDTDLTWVEQLKKYHLTDLDNNPDTLSACEACHLAIDPIGFAFENYTLNGQYVDNYFNGKAIDASGWFEPLDYETDVDDLKFDGAIEISKILASSEQATRCFSDTWLTFALARTMNADGDVCAADELAKSFSNKNYSLKELLLAVVSNPGFRYRNPDAQ